MIFLHGFPETSIMWERLMEKLSSLGYYCIAPDMRGYSANACPKGVENYRVDELRDDVLNIANSLGVEKFHLVGHDWGAAIGWNIVYSAPERIWSWTALSVPHTRAFRKALKLDKEQKKKSRYIGWFLVPMIPELILRRGDLGKFRRLWRNSSPEELENYLSVFRRKESLTAALNYYRANIGKGKNTLIGPVEAPVLFIWGNRDLAIGAFAAKGNHEYMVGEYTYLEVDGGHWLMQTNYSEVEEAIVSHISKYGSAKKKA